ncbi:hypothetical protein FKM82_023906 [Ascaphus truei]
MGTSSCPTSCPSFPSPGTPISCHPPVTPIVKQQGIVIGKHVRVSLRLGLAYLAGPRRDRRLRWSQLQGDWSSRRRPHLG